MESLFAIKEFFEKTIKSKNLDSRSENFYVNSSNRSNYMFNSKITGIEESDLIILIGTNPRYEATILNSRIRKAYLNNNTDIFSIGNVGELTYPYTEFENRTKIIYEIVNDKHKLSDLIKQSQKPIIVLGQSLLKMKSAPYVFEELKKYLLVNKKINNEWNALNILSNNASTVGAYDLGIFSSNNGNNNTLEKIKNNEFDIIFLFANKYFFNSSNTYGADFIFNND